MGVDPASYRDFEAALRAADHLSPLARLKAIVALTWWLTWAEDLSARVRYVYEDIRILTHRWPGPTITTDDDVLLLPIEEVPPDDDVVLG